MLIQKNGMTLNVSRGAYLSLFEQQGWKPVKGTKSNKKSSEQTNFMSPQPDKPEEVEQDQKEKIDASEIPFGNMMGNEEPEEGNEEVIENDEDYEIVLEELTVKELVEYAEEHNIDLDGVTGKANIIKAIKEAEER